MSPLGVVARREPRLGLRPAPRLSDVPPRLIAGILLVLAVPVVFVACRALQRRGILDRFQANVFIAAVVVIVALGMIVLASLDQLPVPSDLGVD